MSPDNLITLRRSVIYVPGTNISAIDKAKTLPVDGVILDLEDSVAPIAKTSAREAVLETIRRGGFGHRELLIRVNDVFSPWGYEDLAAAANSGADGIVLPKVESPETVRKIRKLLDGLNAPFGLGLWCTLETPHGIMNAKQIVLSSVGCRLTGLLMGAADLAKDLHCMHTSDREPFLTSISLCILAARAAGIVALDSPFFDVEDIDGFAEECRQGVELGFDGKTIIHPSQVEIANAAYSPSTDAVAWAHKVVEVGRKSEREGSGATLLDGKLVELLHVQQAQRIIDIASAIQRVQMQSAE